MIYAQFPYVDAISPHGIHLRTAHLPLTVGHPVFVGAHAMRKGIVSHVQGRFFVGGAPLDDDGPHLYLDLREREGLFACAEWLGFYGVHGLLLDEPSDRSPALAHMLYLRKVNGLLDRDVAGYSFKSFIVTATDKQRGIDTEAYVARGAIYDDGVSLRGIIGRMP